MQGDGGGITKHTGGAVYRESASSLSTHRSPKLSRAPRRTAHVRTARAYTGGYEPHAERFTRPRHPSRHSRTKNLCAGAPPCAARLAALARFPRNEIKFRERGFVKCDGEYPAFHLRDNSVSRQTPWRLGPWRTLCEHFHLLTSVRSPAERHLAGRIGSSTGMTKLRSAHVSGARTCNK